MRLRAHHLLCFLGFQGQGYDECFIEKVTTLTTSFKNDPDQPIQLVAYPDVLCSACPHLGCYGCGQGVVMAQAIRDRDKRVLQYLRLKEGDVITPRQAEERIRQYVRPEMLKDICAGCEWMKLGYCEQGIKQLLSDG